MLIRFIETKTFTRKLFKLWNEEAYLDFQDDLLANPDLGDLIQGGDGLRKIRRRVAGVGKSGGLRIIYFWAVSRDIILMLDIYPKSKKSDLTKQELQDLVDIKRQNLGE
jgi:mRNA-degrading endonuclease RelE of RelBE toxin-antitoxin system